MSTAKRSIIEVATDRRSSFVDISTDLEMKFNEMNATDGLCHLYCPHTTAGLTINEGVDRAVARDILKTLDRLVPHYGDYAHMEGNSDAHVKSTLVGVSLMIGVEAGKLLLGQWQRVFFCEFDGPRARQVWVRFIGNTQR